MDNMNNTTVDYMNSNIQSVETMSMSLVMNDAYMIANGIIHDVIHAGIVIVDNVIKMLLALSLIIILCIWFNVTGDYDNVVDNVVHIITSALS